MSLNLKLWSIRKYSRISAFQTVICDRRWRKLGTYRKDLEVQNLHSYIRTKIGGLRGSCSASCWSYPFMLSIPSICVCDHICSCCWSYPFMLLIISVHVDHIHSCCWSHPFLFVIISVHVVDHIRSCCWSYPFPLLIISVCVVDHIPSCYYWSYSLILLIISMRSYPCMLIW